MPIPTIRRPEENKWEVEAEKGGMGSLTGLDPAMMKTLQTERQHQGLTGGPPPTMRPPAGQEERYRFKEGMPIDPRLRAAMLLRKKLQSVVGGGPQTAEPPRRMT